VLFSVARTVLSFAAWQTRVGHQRLWRDTGRPVKAVRPIGGSRWLGFEPITGATGVPLISGALVDFECERYALHDGGDHLIVVGRVLGASRPAGSASRRLVFFFSGRYHQIDRPRQGCERERRALFAWLVTRTAMERSSYRCSSRMCRPRAEARRRARRHRAHGPRRGGLRRCRTRRGRLHRSRAFACLTSASEPRNRWAASQLRVTGGKTLNEYMFSELPQVADIVRSAGSLRPAKDGSI
jgi:Flavin reductase like domain